MVDGGTLFVWLRAPGFGSSRGRSDQRLPQRHVAGAPAISGTRAAGETRYMRVGKKICQASRLFAVRLSTRYARSPKR
jgi:hypothetical protein